MSKQMFSMKFIKTPQSPNEVSGKQQNIQQTPNKTNSQQFKTPKEFINNTQSISANDDPLFEANKVRILTGSIKQILEWHDNNKESVLYEVIAHLMRMSQPNAQKSEINFVMKDKYQVGPPLIVKYPYYMFPELPSNLRPGLLIRCVGKLTNDKKMIAMKVSLVSYEEEGNYNRLAHVSEYF